MSTPTIVRISSTSPVTAYNVRMLANDLIELHGLADDGWRFEWHRAATKAGMCHYGPKLITLSRPTLEHRTMDQIKNTILHEVAHALVGIGHGHGNVWRNTFIRIGGNGERTSEVNDYRKVAGRYEVRCTEDNAVLHVALRSNFKVSSRQCRKHRVPVRLWDRQTKTYIK